MVQVVHYPLFAFVGNDRYVEYQTRHQKLTTLVVGPAMLIEAFTTVLIAWYPPPGVSVGFILGGIFLLFIIWISTAAVQVPCHGKLARGFDAKTLRILVSSNWIRTIAWSARGALMAWLLMLVLASN